MKTPIQVPAAAVMTALVIAMATPASTLQIKLDFDGDFQDVMETKKLAWIRFSTALPIGGEMK